jgi:hypothetical protein
MLQTTRQAASRRPEEAGAGRRYATLINKNDPITGASPPAPCGLRRVNLGYFSDDPDGPSLKQPKASHPLKGAKNLIILASRSTKGRELPLWILLLLTEFVAFG